MLFVFNLRFGQRRLVRHAPVNRLAPAIDITLREEGEKRLGDNRLILGVHRQVGFLPFSKDAQALEAVSLEVHEFFGVAPARLPDLDRAHLRLAGPELLLNIDLDRQPVAVPAGQIRGVETCQGLGLDDEVFQNFVECRPQVDRPVGVRRTVMQGIKRGSLASRANLTVEVVLGPFRKPLGLVLRQIRFHRKAGSGKIECTFQIGRFLHSPSGA